MSFFKKSNQVEDQRASLDVITFDSLLENWLDFENFVKIPWKE
jgi:hypothetical protein